MAFGSVSLGLSEDAKVAEIVVESGAVKLSITELAEVFVLARHAINEASDILLRSDESEILESVRDILDPSNARCARTDFKPPANSIN